jgi:protein-tyrosine phosphatase
VGTYLARSETNLLQYIAKQYGRKSGLLRHWWSLWRDRFGLLRSFRTVEWRRVERLVFVCQGNICRSPYAEARARASGLSNASSFGLNATPGLPAHSTMLRLSPLELSQHRTRARSGLILTSQDLLIGMEPWHGQALRLLETGGAQVTLLGLWGAYRRPHIEDPFGLSDDYFRTCMSIIDDAVRQLAGFIKREDRNPAISSGGGPGAQLAEELPCSRG